MSDKPFELYFTTSQIAERLPLSVKVIRARVKSGFFSPPGIDGEPDLSNLVKDGDEFFVPLSGVLFYLEQRRAAPAAAGMVLDRLRPVQMRTVSAPVPARTPGELRRKTRDGDERAVA